MDTKNLIARAHQSAKSNSGYSYNPTTLESIITSGEVPEGVTLAAMGGQVITRRGNNVICTKGGTVTRTTPLDDSGREALLVSYAVLASKTSVKTGN